MLPHLGKHVRAISMKLARGFGALVTAAIGPTLPTWATRQAGSYLRYTGRDGANKVTTPEQSRLVARSRARRSIRFWRRIGSRISGGSERDVTGCDRRRGTLYRRAALDSGVRLAKASPGPASLPSAVMTTVRRILDQKGHQVWFVHPDDTVYDAIKMMADKNVGALVVLDGSKMVGIVTERDYARNVFLKGRASPQTPVSEIMERNVVCVEPDKSIEECMAIMSAKRVRHLPVINDGELLGIVSIGDLVKSIIGDREFAIEQLDITSAGPRRRPQER
jgi:CBS domain-containing protein